LLLIYTWDRLRITALFFPGLENCPKGWEKHHNFEETVNMNNEYVPGEFEQLLFIGHFA